ncbi:hypothetical protein X777_05009 [Ooceraea biroi]|uniref:Uncharacterized protein n=1 Tax=Ooceraea biroi TaxID=2015173 RepID=A0A026WHZ6_OOCBI|nr:hypothetical protein X777_05009 [Ooceraea biroi]
MAACEAVKDLFMQINMGTFTLHLSTPTGTLRKRVHGTCSRTGRLKEVDENKIKRRSEILDASFNNREYSQSRRMKSHRSVLIHAPRAPSSLCGTTGCVKLVGHVGVKSVPRSLPAITSCTGRLPAACARAP